MERNTSSLPTFPTPVSWPLSQADHEPESQNGHHGDRWAWWTVGVLEGAFGRVARVMGQVAPRRAVPLEVLGRMYEQRQLELLAEAADPAVASRLTANGAPSVAHKVGEVVGDVSLDAGAMAIGMAPVGMAPVVTRLTTRCVAAVATAARAGGRGERRQQAATERRFAAMERDSGDVVEEMLGALRGSTG